MSKVLSALNGALPDERPLLSMLIVESVAKCPAGYWPVSKTYDEDADAGLLKQNGLFGKKPSHYICLSKSEGVPGYVMDGIAVVGERESAPAGFSVAGRAGKRRICSRVSRAGAVTVTPPVTDVIVCSKMRQAPQGFVLAGEINGKVLCYKVCGGGTPPGDGHDYMNVVSNITPEANRSDYAYDGDEMPTSIYSMCWGGSANKYRLRPVPERPPKTSPLISDLHNLNLKQSPAYPSIEEFTTGHDYEVLNTSYAAKPARPAPRPPTNGSPIVHGSPNAPSPSPAHRHKKQPAPLPRPCNYQTLGGYSGLEGVPFLLNPKLRGLHSDEMTQLPVIKKRTLFELEQEYTYSFAVERQT